MSVPQCVSVRRRPLIKTAVSAAVFAAACMLYFRKLEGAWLPVDSLFMAGLLCLIVGCWNLVRWLGLFDSTVYGFKKLAHHMQAGAKNAPPMEPMPSLADYMSQPKVLPSAGEPLLVAAVCIALSVIVMLIG